ncbi:MAG: squalene/phytoene synthase family protein [Anaerolineae bacterium]
MEAHYDMLRKVSRTFALSIELLPDILRDAITLAYLLFRVSDCLEDHEALPTAEKVTLLRRWARVLEGVEPVQTFTASLAHLDSHDDEVYVAQHADAILKRVQNLPEALQTILTRGAHSTTLGMARWQVHGPYVEDEAALDDYMHQVAGKVGYLVTDLFAWYVPRLQAKMERLKPLAREFGLALQTVNIVRGMRKDYERGWVFVPQTFYEPLGLTRDSLFDPANLDKAMQVVAQLADKAERHLDNGLAYVLEIPRFYHRLRLACMWPLLFAVKTLAASRDNPDVLLDEAKMTRHDVKEIILKTRLLGWSNWWLQRYYDQLSG